jgi:hypothetical protein
MRRTVNDHKEDILNELTAARQSILCEINKLSPAQVDEPCIGTWSVKDLIAHLVGWDFTNLQAVQEILAGKRPSFLQHYDRDWQTYNASLVAQYRRESIQEAMTEVEASHAELVGYLLSLPAGDLMDGKSPKELGRPVTIRNLLRSEAGDERKHAADLQAYFNRNSTADPSNSEPVPGG